MHLKLSEIDLAIQIILSTILNVTNWLLIIFLMCRLNSNKINTIFILTNQKWFACNLQRVSFSTIKTKTARNATTKMRHWLALVYFMRWTNIINTVCSSQVGLEPWVCLRGQGWHDTIFNCYPSLFPWIKCIAVEINTNAYHSRVK